MRDYLTPAGDLVRGGTFRGPSFFLPFFFFTYIIYDYIPCKVYIIVDNIQFINADYTGSL